MRSPTPTLYRGPRRCWRRPPARSEIGRCATGGTIGGNLSHADPPSDLPAAALALDATLHVTGPGGSRAVSASDFFVDLMMTALQPDEILTEVEIPAAQAGTGSAYVKFEHPASGYALCGAAAIVTRNADGSCASAPPSASTASPPLRWTRLPWWRAWPVPNLSDGAIGKRGEREPVDPRSDGRHVRLVCLSPGTGKGDRHRGPAARPEIERKSSG